MFADLGSNFGKWLLLSALQGGIGTAVLHAKISTIRNCYLAMSSADEQEHKLLREYRSRFFAGVVTGKLYVRHAACNPSGVPANESIGRESAEEIKAEMEGPA